MTDDGQVKAIYWTALGTRLTLRAESRRVNGVYQARAVICDAPVQSCYHEAVNVLHETDWHAQQGGEVWYRTTDRAVNSANAWMVAAMTAHNIRDWTTVGGETAGS